MKRLMICLELVLAVLMIVCLFNMPYGYFTFVRFAAMVILGVLALQCAAREQKEWAFIFGVSALLFQPFFKVALGRMMWNVVDIIEAVVLIVFILLVQRRQ